MLPLLATTIALAGWVDVPACPDERAFPAASRDANRAVVDVRVADQQTRGIVIAPDGWVLTTAAGLRPDSSLAVSSGGGPEHPARLVALDYTVGLALVRVDLAGLPCIPVRPELPATGTPLYDLAGLGGPLVDAEGRLVGFDDRGDLRLDVPGFTNLLPIAHVGHALEARWHVAERVPVPPAPPPAGAVMTARPFQGGEVLAQARHAMVRVDLARGGDFRSYAIGAVEVNQDLWYTVMGKNPSRFKSLTKPVERVTFRLALEFCNALSEREGLPAAYTLDGDQVTWDPAATGYRLPTQAEWLLAARAGATSSFAGGERAQDVAWYWDSGIGQPRPGGQKAANGWGLWDMSGNVAEWVWIGDLVQPIDGGPGEVRGGSWRSSTIDLRPDRAGKRDKSVVKDTIGLRIARYVD